MGPDGMKAPQAVALEKQTDAPVHVAGFALRAALVADDVDVQPIVIGKIIDGDTTYGKFLGNAG